MVSNTLLPERSTAPVSFLPLLRLPQLFKTIWEVETSSEFRDAFLDLFQTHYQAYKIGVLHHGVSYVDRPVANQNLDHIVHSSNPTTVTQNGESKCLSLLYDLDHGRNIIYASDIDCATEIPLDRPPCSTFTPLDFLLLEDDSPLPPYRYRHDLESFLYILIWTAMHHNPRTQRKRLTKDLVSSWESRGQDWSSSYRHRSDKSRIQGRLTASTCSETFLLLFNEWIEPLFYLNTLEVRRALRRGTWGMTGEETSVVMEAKLASASWKDSRDGLLTFEKYMDIFIGRKPQKRGLNRCRYTPY